MDETRPYEFTPDGDVHVPYDALLDAIYGPWDDPAYQAHLDRLDAADARDRDWQRECQGPDDADQWVPDNVARLMERFVN